MLTPSATVCVIGFGESGSAVAAGLAQRGYAVRAWDPLLGDPVSHAAMRARIENARVDPASSMCDAMRGAKLVVCAAGAATAASVRNEVAGFLVAGQELLDLDTTPSAAQLEILGFAYDPAAGRAGSHQAGAHRHARRGELP